MKVETLKPLNHKGKTVEVNTVLDLDDVAAKKLIKVNAVKEIKEITTTVVEKAQGEINA